MAKNPLVSVIVTTRNSMRTLEACLGSIKRQSYKRLELIVVDNKSTDGTLQLAKRYSRKVFSAGPERHVQRNYGLKKARGKYLVFIDSDMELASGLVAEAVGKCESKGCGALILPEVSVGRGFWARCRMLEKRCYLEDSRMEAANRFILRNAYVGVGGYDDELIVGEDFDLHEKLVAAGVKISRARAVIKHHEVRSFGEMLAKHFYYGSLMPTYLRRHPLDGTGRFFPLRPAYFRNWRLFLRDPLHGSGLVVMKVLQYLVAGVGFLWGVLKTVFRR